jgi:hypothetical protein
MKDNFNSKTSVGKEKFKRGIIFINEFLNPDIIYDRPEKYLVCLDGIISKKFDPLEDFSIRPCNSEASEDEKICFKEVTGRSFERVFDLAIGLSNTEINEGQKYSIKVNRTTNDLELERNHLSEALPTDDKFVFRINKYDHLFLGKQILVDKDYYTKRQTIITNLAELSEWNEIDELLDVINELNNLI